MTEIFVEPELENLSDVVNAAEWQSICSELGLEGQNKLTEKSEQNMAPPYMFIDPKTERIIRTLCPRKVRIEQYNASTIPLEILQEVKRCREHGWYDSIYVFYDDKTPDPFVVGFINKEWSSPKHLIGRWGPELIPMELLESRAVERLKDMSLERLNGAKAAIEYAIKNSESFIRSLLSGEEAPKTNISIDSLGSSNW